MTIGNGRTILVVEDDHAVRKLITGVLRAEGHHVLSTAQGEEALAASESHPGEIHLAITDFSLGDMNGVQVAKHLSGKRPRMGILMISGYTEIPVPKEMRDSLPSEFLPKPFTIEDLLAKVAEMLGKVP